MTQNNGIERLRRLVRDEFKNQNEHIHRVVKAELLKQHGVSMSTPVNRARMVGMFIGACAHRQGMTADQLAAASGITGPNAAALINGELKQDDYTDELLERLAAAVGYESSVLRLMLGRPYGEEEAMA
ncbi:MAG: hypothetical protein IH587_10870 [Anaerolineae bacterium]|nr:hypothetical protein [Anaerolineae bacterium]